jgi:hypothetical protein
LPCGPQVAIAGHSTATTCSAIGTVALGDHGQRRETDLVTSPRATSVFAGFRFPPEAISVAVRWYLRYGLSYRDVEELLAERGITVDHVTSTGGVQRVHRGSPAVPPCSRRSLVRR